MTVDKAEVTAQFIEMSQDRKAVNMFLSDTLVLDVISIAIAKLHHFVGTIHLKHSFEICVAVGNRGILGITLHAFPANSQVVAGVFGTDKSRRL